jgi:hypothetical protein
MSFIKIMLDQKIQLNKPDNSYLCKKTEKLVSAIYLLTNFISDREPIKWQLRETGLELVSKGLSVNSKILSFLEIAYVGGLVSEMNYRILKFELEGLFQIVVESENNPSSLILSEDFFTVSGQGNSSALGGVSLASNPKGHNIMSDRLSVKNIETKEKPVRLGC